jgi:hypothetical protein
MLRGMHTLLTFAEPLPLWALVMAALVPLLPFFAREIAWIYRRDRFTALFSLLVATQSAHALDQVARLMTGEGLAIAASPDLAGLHLAWHAGVLLGLAILLARFRTNAWLAVTLGLTILASVAGGTRLVPWQDLLVAAPLVLAFLRHLEGLAQPAEVSTRGRAGG